MITVEGKASVDGGTSFFGNGTTGHGVSLVRAAFWPEASAFLTHFSPGRGAAVDPHVPAVEAVLAQRAELSPWPPCQSDVRIPQRLKAAACFDFE